MRVGGFIRGFIAAALMGGAPHLVAASGDLHDLPFVALEEGLQSNAVVLLTPRGLEFDVEAPVHLLLPLAGARELELELHADAPLLLTFAAESGGRARLMGPPWRYRSVSPGATTLVLDMREAAGWGNGSRPVLLFEGAAHVVLTRLRAGAPAPTEDVARREADRVAFWSSDPVGPKSINFVTPPLWRTSDSTYLADVVATASVALLVAVLGGVWLVRRKWRPGVAVAAAALFAIGAHGLHAALRFVPAWHLTPEVDPEARIRDHYEFAPQLGPLAAVARAQIGLDERVGVVGDPRDSFGPQTLCFNLAPRRCVVVNAGESEHRGISGVGRLSGDDLDVLVYYDAVAPASPDFAPVAAVSRRASIVRRR